MDKRWQALGVLIAVVVAFLIVRNRGEQPFALARADRSVSAPSAYPLAVDSRRVGTYPPETSSGAGYFYDEVLEYRVWFHPENGAMPLNGNGDYFVAFAQYEKANALSKAARGAEEPLVLVRQIEWIDEPEPSQYVRKNEERITEWQVAWLAGSKRTVESITDFLKHPRPARTK
jgi:hypothetical protein